MTLARNRRWLILCGVWLGAMSLLAAQGAWPGGVAFVVHPDGYLITCAHLVQDVAEIEVALGGVHYPATLLGTDPKHDLALLRIKAAHLPCLRLGNSNAMTVGVKLRTLDFTLHALELPPTDSVNTPTFNNGAVTAIATLDTATVFRTDLPFKPDFDGAPAVNARGEVVGVTDAHFTKIGQESVNTSVLAPINAAKTLMEQEEVPFVLQGKGGTLSDAALAQRLELALGSVQVRTAASMRVNARDNAMMVLVPDGPFLMGTNAAPGQDNRDNEAPQRSVKLAGYWIYKFEVTVAQYRSFCQDTKRPMPDAPPWGWRDTDPVVNVCWSDAHAYADWAGAALPTEAQWEKAARGTDGRTFPWTGPWDGTKCAWWDNALPDSAVRTVKPVGSYPEDKSPYGAMDMAGNAMEWCADWYDPHYYATAPAENPLGPATGAARVLRGGSWRYSFPARFRCAARYFFDPAFRGVGVGFRCVVSAL